MYVIIYSVLFKSRNDSGLPVCFRVLKLPLSVCGQCSIVSILLLPASSLVNPQAVMFSGFLSSSQALGVSCCNLRSSLEDSTPTQNETEATLKKYTEQKGAKGEGRGDWF